MTDTIRNEMKMYKEQAMAIERRLYKESCQNKNPQPPSEENVCSETSLSKTDAPERNLPDFSSMSLIDGNESGTSLKETIHSTDHYDSTSDRFADQEIVLSVSDLLETRSLKKLSEPFAEDNDSDAEDKRGDIIRSLPPQLIRSNSYTLDMPSPLLVKFMQSKGIDMTTTIAHPIESKQDVPANWPTNNVPSITIQSPITNVPSTTLSKASKIKANVRSISIRDKPSKPKSQINRKPKIEVPKRAMATAKSAAMVYKTKNTTTSSVAKERLSSTPLLIVKSKTSQQAMAIKPKLALSTTLAANETKSKSTNCLDSRSPNRIVSPKISSENEDKILKFLKNFEEERNAQMLDLIERQKIEQKQMHDSFLMQQQLLVQQITENCSNIFSGSCQKVVTMNVSTAPRDKSVTTLSPITSDCSSYAITSCVSKIPKRISLSPPNTEIEADVINNNSTNKQTNDDQRLPVAGCNRQLFGATKSRDSVPGITMVEY